MKKLLVVILACGMSLAAYAQQTPLFSLIDDNITMINPAAYRSEFMFNDYSFFVNTTYRSQWSSFEYAPKTTLVQVSSWLPDWSNWENFGNTRVGFDFVMDDIDPIKVYGFYGQFAHQVPLRNDNKRFSFLSAGLNIGAIMHNLNTVNLTTSDIYVSNIDASSATLDAGVGIMYGQYKKQDDYRNGGRKGYYVGLSIPQVTGLDFRVTDEGRRVDIDRVQHYYAIAGAQFGSFNRMLLRPTVMLNYAPRTPLHIDARIEAQPIEQFWFGIGGSMTNKSLSFRIGSLIPYYAGFAKDSRESAIRIGASYTHFMSDLYKLGGTYEITIAWMIDNYDY